MQMQKPPTEVTPHGGFTDGNGRFVTAGTRVEYRFGARAGTVNEIFPDGSGWVTFDDTATSEEVNWNHLCALPPEFDPKCEPAQKRKLIYLA
jgi:hypothetical protein